MAASGEATNRQLLKLREFSLQLAQRLKEAPTKPTEPTRLAVRIGPENYLIEMALAGEIVSLPEISPVPWTRPWYRGLANVRGRLIGVVDFLHLTGRGPLPAEQTQQILVLGEVLGVHAGILVTRAFGIRNLKDLTLIDGVAPEGRASWEQARYRDNDGVTMTELELRELRNVEQFRIDRGMSGARYAPRNKTDSRNHAAIRCRPSSWWYRVVKAMLVVEE